MSKKARSSGLVVIVGQTASGKSRLAMELAQRYDGEIICADSRTIYKGLDIGTAKPTADDRRKVVHHCLDLVDPSQRYSVAEFQKLANNIIDDINSRGRVAFLVGGSGLYIDSVIYNLKFDAADGLDLKDKSLDELQKISQEMGLAATPSTYSNPRHLAGFIRDDSRGIALARREGKSPHRDGCPQNLRTQDIARI